MKIIESITIRYFRSVYTLTLNPCGDMTVITGKNDVGKSNVLKALNLFFNQQSDYNQKYDFGEDYSIIRKEEVRKDTIRGQQFISISIKFNRGDRMPYSLPPHFTVTKRWDMHSQTCKQSSDVQTKMQQYAKSQGIKYSEKTTTTSLSAFLNKIRFVYIPAIKDSHVFSETLDLLQQSLFDSRNKQILDIPIGEANKAVQAVIGELQDDFKKSTGIDNFVELPTTLNYTNGLLQINTHTNGGTVTIDKRGDGIRTHYIPKILHYLAQRSSKMFIWGFEEPENSYEYRRCIQVAEEFDSQYCRKCQIFITSHSPAFFNENKDKKKLFFIGKDEGKTVLIPSHGPLAEELGYIELYRHFISQVKDLKKQSEEKEEEICRLQEIIRTSTVPILLTEGKTDAELLKLAAERLGLQQYTTWKIQPIKSGQTSSNEVLLKYLLELRDNMQLTMPVIGMFDRDTRLPIDQSGIEIDIRDKRFVQIANNLFAFAIPVPHDRPQNDQISIEHYFTDGEIKTKTNGKRLFLGTEFYPTGVYIGDEDYFYRGAAKLSGTIKVIEHETRCYVTSRDGNGDFSISKAKFVEKIRAQEEGFASLSFCEFERIFAVLDEIISCTQSR